MEWRKPTEYQVPFPRANERTWSFLDYARLFTDGVMRSRWNAFEETLRIAKCEQGTLALPAIA